MYKAYIRPEFQGISPEILAQNMVRLRTSIKMDPEDLPIELRWDPTLMGNMFDPIEKLLASHDSHDKKRSIFLGDLHRQGPPGTGKSTTIFHILDRGWGGTVEQHDCRNLSWNSKNMEKP